MLLASFLMAHEKKQQYVSKKQEMEAILAGKSNDLIRKLKGSELSSFAQHQELLVVSVDSATGTKKYGNWPSQLD